MPGGRTFQLDISGRKPFLTHQSELGQFSLSSDSITHTYANRGSIKPFIDDLPQDLKNFVLFRGWLISESILFPAGKVDGKMTINGARGFDRKIGDRFDLTLECIRRHYRGQVNPLEDVLNRYASFFRLFVDFRGYVSFFLLDDLVDESYENVKFLHPFDDFCGSPLPGDFQAYLDYVTSVRTFSQKRAERIVGWLRDNRPDCLSE